jgi:hypothetical protein
LLRLHKIDRLEQIPNISLEKNIKQILHVLMGIAEPLKMKACPEELSKVSKTRQTISTGDRVTVISPYLTSSNN